MSIEVMRQVRNALVWNLNTDLDNIPACEQWANMLRKNIDALDKALAHTKRTWVGLTDEELAEYADMKLGSYDLCLEIEARLKEKNTKDDIQVYASDTAILQTLLPKLYSIIDRLIDGQDKALVIEARRILPTGYKNSFEKEKNNG